MNVAIHQTLPSHIKLIGHVMVGLLAWHSIAADNGRLVLTPVARAGELPVTGDVAERDEPPAPPLANEPEIRRAESSEDPFLVAKLAEIGGGASNAFLYVRNKIDYEVYPGSLRGARGTMWSQAGNSLDQASLLIALLELQGIEANWVRGTLDEEDARGLVMSMFDPGSMASAVGYIPDRYPLADPANDAQLLNEASDHWWVQLADGAALDPSFGDAVAGATRGKNGVVLTEIPDELVHKVTVRLKAEFHNILSQFTHKTPLEHTFTTAEVYGRALTFGHFVDERTIGFIGGVRTFYYAPYLMIDDNDGDITNDELIRGETYQENFVSLFAGLANSTLTRLSLEFDVLAPGKEVETLSRDLLDRVGFAARRGLAEPQAVDSERPALTEFDLTSCFITPGMVDPGLFLGRQERLEEVFAELDALEPRVDLIAKQSTLKPDDQAIANRYADLNREQIVLAGSFNAAAFLLESDYYLNRMRLGYRTHAYYDGPRITLFKTQTRTTEEESSIRVGLDLVRNHVKAEPYPGDNEAGRYTFNLSKGVLDSVLEHAVVEHFLGAPDGELRLAASPIAVFRQSQAEGAPLVVIKNEREIASKLEPLEISVEAKARISQALREGRTVNVPARMIELGGRPAIGWWEYTPQTGEMIAVSEDGGHQNLTEFVLILALVGVAGVVSLIIVANNLKNFFSRSSSKYNTYKPFDWKKAKPTGIPAPGTLGATPTVPITDCEGDPCTFDFGDFTLSGIPTEFGAVLESAGSSGSVVEFLGEDIEVVSLSAPGPSEASAPMVAGDGLTLETVPESFFAVEAAGDAQIPAAFRARLSRPLEDAPATMETYGDRIGDTFFFQLTGSTDGDVWGTDIYADRSDLTAAAVHAGFLDAGETGVVAVSMLDGMPSYTGSERYGVLTTNSGARPASYRFEALPPESIGEVTLTGTAPEGWNLLIAREVNPIPPGGTGEVGVYLQPRDGTALPAPGTSLEFTLKASLADEAVVARGAELSQTVGFTMPEVYGVLMKADPGTLYTTPTGTVTTDVTFTSTGNVAQQIQLSPAFPDAFTVEGLQRSVSLNPGQSVTQTLTFTARDVEIDTSHTGRVTGVFGPAGEEQTRELSLAIHVSAPGALPSLRASADAELAGRSALSSTLRSLGEDSSRLYRDPGDAVVKVRFVATLESLTNQLAADSLLAPFAAGITAARAAIVASTPATLPAALDNFGTQVTSLAGRMALVAAHDFEIRLAPSDAVAQPGTPARFGLVLKNKGTETTTVELALEGVPAGVTADLSQTSITLPPGFGIAPGVTGSDFLNVSVNVILTQSGDELRSFDFRVVATAREAGVITHTAHGVFTAREEFFKVLSVAAEPPVIDPAAMQTTIGVFTGGDAGEGLDLDGDFLYALNIGENGAPGWIRDANFTTDNVPGVTVVATRRIDSWHAVNFGDSPNDDRIEQVIDSIRWDFAASPVTVDLAGLEPGARYRLQALVSEPTDSARAFDILVEGARIVDDLSPAAVSSTAEGVVVAHEFTARDETLNIAVDGRVVSNAFADHNPTLSGVTLEKLPGGQVTARLLNGANTVRPVLGRFTLRDADGAAVFASEPVALELSVRSSISEVALGEFPIAILENGLHTIEAVFTEVDGTPLPDGEGLGTLFVGTPVTANLTADPDKLLPGDGLSRVELEVGTGLDYGESGVALIGIQDTDATAQNVAIHANHAYVGGTEDLTILEVSDARRPRTVGTLEEGLATLAAVQGEHLYVLNGPLELKVFDLTNPAQPAPLSTAASTVSGTFLTGFMVHGDIAVANMAIFLWSGTNIVAMRGDANLYDISDPNDPVPLGLFYNTPQTFHPEWPGSNYYIGPGSAGSGDVVYLPSTTVAGSAQGGTGLIRMLDVGDPANVTELPGFEVPGTAVLHGIAVQGNRALVVGSTGHFTVQGSPQPTGDLTLHLLDVSSPRSPAVLASTTVTGVGLNQHRTSVSAGTDGLFAIEEVLIAGQPRLLVVDTTNPGALEVVQKAVPSAVDGSRFAGDYLYTASNSGLSVYDFGGLKGIPVTASVEIANDAETSPVPGSFNMAPNQIVPGAGFDTYTWDLTLERGMLSRTLSWETAVKGLAAGGSRDLTAGGEVEFTVAGTTGRLPLAPLSVSSDHLLGLDPGTAMVQPGAPADYIVTFRNPTNAQVTYNVDVLGIADSWASIPAQVTVPATSEVQRTLTLISDPFAAPGEHAFAVRANLDTVHGTLVLRGRPQVPDEAHGVHVELMPTNGIAGQGTPAEYVVRLVNTGNVTEIFTLGSMTPQGVAAVFGQDTIELPPGLENYREVGLTLTPQPGTAAGNQSFTVTATSTVNAGVRGEDDDALDISNIGVALAFNPVSGPPNSTFNLMIQNTGTVAQTFDLDLGETGVIAASLAQDTVTLTPGTSQVVPVIVGDVDFVTPGALPLSARASAQGNPDIRVATQASVVIPERRGVSTEFQVDFGLLPSAGATATLALFVDNTGNLEEAYIATINDTTGSLTASFRGFGNSIDSFRLPAQAGGLLLVDVSGIGSVTAEVTSRSNPEITDSATARMQVLQLNIAEVAAGMELTFDPVAGFDHVVQSHDRLGEDAAEGPWTDLPDPPHNGGLIIDDTVNGIQQRYYRVLLLGSGE